MNSDQPSTQNVRCQNVRDFTVQIRHASTDSIVGTGFVVSNQGHIVTCAHVVHAAGIFPGATGEGLQGMEVGIYFPQILRADAKAHRARVVGCFPQYDDDVVLLQLLSGPTPLSPDQIAVLGQAKLSEGHPFRSYGYRRLSDYDAGLADGTIQGLVETPRGHKVQAEPVQLLSSQINHGMSGAAVLDMDKQRNLVVGVISETWYPDSSTKDRDTAWAVDARVLSLEPLNMALQDEPYTSRPMPQPRTNIVETQAATDPHPGPALYGAPPALTEERWAGRVDLLHALNTDWADPACHLSELIGFGGEGKSSLARHWLDNLLHNPTQPQPDGVFWWNCYDQPNVDALLEAALQYLSGVSIDPRRLTSGSVRAQVIGAMLGVRRYLFILDGLEVLQHQEGDAYGLLINADLRELLGYFAAPGHNSFCMLTSRAPLFDLINYTTFRHHDVERLSQEDGRVLLSKVGVKGPVEAVDQVVADWDGHALTLSLLGSYLVERHAGDVAHMSDIPAPTANETRFARVQRVLHSYDAHLTEAERVFLMLFSAFRLPVTETALASVFRARTRSLIQAVSTKPTNILNAPIAKLNDAAFNTLLKQLVAYRILHYDSLSRNYTAHPLIRAYYVAHFNACDRTQVQAVHERIKDYYLSLARKIPSAPKVNDLVPLLEAVHHACRAEAYDEAFNIFRLRIDQRSVLLQQMGAYETGLALLLEFFPEGDIYQEPLVSPLSSKKSILNLVGFCLMLLGRQSEAIYIFERSIVMDLSSEQWLVACINYQNIADLHADLGAITASADASREALFLARRAQDKKEESNSLTGQAWAAHLLGDLETSSALFQQAETLLHEIHPQFRYLYSLPGLKHADHLQRVGKANYARKVIEANLKLVANYQWLTDESFCHRVLGDLDAEAGESQSAQHHYDEALKVARSSSARWVLIEALLAQGRWATRCREIEAAYRYLDEALSYAVAGRYRIYEMDISIALAWAYFAAGDATSARAQAERTQLLSTEMSYYWGKVDAAEVLAVLDSPTPEQ